MLDRKHVVENAAAVKQNCLHRGADADVDRLVELETERREKQQLSEQLNRQANEVSKSIGAAKDNDEREARKAEGRRLREEKDKVAAEAAALDQQIVEILKLIPNLSHPDAPIGVDDKANLEICRGEHEPPTFDFEPLDHVDLAERLDLADFEGGSRVTGHGFYFLRNYGVLLELALQRYALDVLQKEDFILTTTPDLARDEIIEGIGFIPRGPETQIYSIENSALSLIATAEITLGGLFSGQTLSSDDLPIRMCGISHCYRTEAGAHGRATRGLYRVHQFTKVEMFAFTEPDQSDATLEYLRGLEQRIFDGLGLPYRVVDTATGDLGGPAYRKYDLEAWMPGRGDGGEWGEVTSTSNCTDYQARRLNIRYKRKDVKGTRFVHTLNGTAIAMSRAIIAILENYQRADGSVDVPEVLQSWVGTDRLVPK